MEQAGRATWTAKPHKVAASESGDERVQSLIKFATMPSGYHPEMFRFAANNVFRKYLKINMSLRRGLGRHTDVIQASSLTGRAGFPACKFHEQAGMPARQDRQGCLCYHWCSASNDVIPAPKITPNVLGSVNMTMLFKRFGLMSRTCLVAAVLVPAAALALPDDAALTQLLVGTWHGPRHETQYLADGIWILDPPDEGDNTRGKWRIEHGRLIETWRFTDETEDSSSVEEIIELTDKIFKSRIILQEGPGKPEGQVLPSEIFTVTRVTTKK